MLLFGSLVCAFVPYWADSRIHNVGNGRFHASVARLATKIIDIVSYDGRNIRNEIISEYARGTVVDLCCGTGTSTAYGGIGVDTSEDMLREAKWLRGASGKFYVGNAESWGDDDCCDTVTIFFALHEIPSEARQRIYTNALRIAKRRVVICDISPEKVPSDIMLTGEPYLLDFQDSVLNELELVESFPMVASVEKKNLIPNHVLLAIIDKKCEIECEEAGMSSAVMFDVVES